MLHGVSQREQEDGLLNLSYQQSHPDTYNLDHTTAFDYKLQVPLRPDCSGARGGF